MRLLLIGACLFLIFIVYYIVQSYFINRRKDKLILNTKKAVMFQLSQYSSKISKGFLALETGNWLWTVAFCTFLYIGYCYPPSIVEWIFILGFELFIIIYFIMDVICFYRKAFIRFDDKEFVYCNGDETFTFNLNGIDHAVFIKSKKYGLWFLKVIMVDKDSIMINLFRFENPEVIYKTILTNSRNE